eukprot:10032792-Prorocentrum_lima.AAC.1
MFTVLSAATLLSEIELPSGGKRKVKQCCQPHYDKEDASLMHLSEVRTFIPSLFARHHDRET